MAKAKFEESTCSKRLKGQGSNTLSWPFFIRPFGSAYHAVIMVGGERFGSVAPSKSLALAKAFVKAKNYFPGLMSRDRG